MPWNAAAVQGRATTPSLFVRGSEDPLCRVCGSEGKEEGGGKGKGGSWKTETCKRGEKEKIVGVSSIIPGWGVRRRYCFIGEHWEIPGHGI